MNPRKVNRDRLVKLTDLPNIGNAVSGLSRIQALEHLLFCGGGYHSPPVH